MLSVTSFELSGQSSFHLHLHKDAWNLRICITHYVVWKGKKEVSTIMECRGIYALLYNILCLTVVLCFMPGTVFDIQPKHFYYHRSVRSVLMCIITLIHYEIYHIFNTLYIGYAPHSELFGELFIESII